MTELSSGMLQFARERRLNVSEVDLNELAGRIHSLSAPRFQDKDVKLVLNLVDDLPSVRCDRELIHAVVMDLLSNSLDACSWKHYENGGIPEVKFSVRTASHRGYVCIMVSDNGEGMTEEVKEKVFTPFFSTKKRKGTGMGLAVAGRIVASHGGKITVESEPGQGAEFHVWIPIGGPGQGEEEGYVEESVSR